MYGRQGDQVKVPSEGRGKRGWGTTLISQQGANTISINYCICMYCTSTRVCVCVQLQNKQHTTEEKPDIPHTEMSYNITRQEAMEY
jgi:hypothetical protein